MSAFLAEYGLFLLKTLTFVLAIAAAVAMIVAIVSRARKGGGASKGQIEIRKYNEGLENVQEALTMALLDPVQQKEHQKASKAREKAERKAAKVAAKKARKRRGDGETIVEEVERPRTFVLDFDGDIRGSDVDSLRREITAVLTTARTDDEVLLRLESGGGMVTSYGLAASQLDRLRQKKIPLTIAVDKVAASGGYMMACVADTLIAAPFAVVGSIGVVAQIPNFHRLLKANNIDFELLTAGKYKRTLTLFGENTDEGRQKFLEDIERIHVQFKDYVDTHRPSLDIDAVATGEIWSGEDAVRLKLVDRLETSDEYLMQAAEERDVLILEYKARRKFMERLAAGGEMAIDRLAMRWLDRLLRSRYLSG